MQHIEPHDKAMHETVKNYANKRLRSSICESVRPVLTACSPATNKLLTPENILERFEQAGIEAGEDGKLAHHNPLRKHAELTQFGHMLCAAWEIGRRAGCITYRNNRRNA